MMCARLLRHKPESEQRPLLPGLGQGISSRIIAFYGRTLHLGLGSSDRDVARSPRRRSCCTVLLYIVIPKGFFPVQDTGVILGSIRGSAERSPLPPWPIGNRRWPRVILQDPAVASLSSFIGVDGTNTTLNSGRIQINLKPLEERRISASDIIRRLQPQLAKVDGITLFMQPIQDLTVEDRVSRTQFQYSLEDADRE